MPTDDVEIDGIRECTLKTAHTAMGRGIALEFNRSQYRAWNALDIELYHYAMKLAKLDCDFFLRIEEGEGRMEEGGDNSTNVTKAIIPLEL